MVDESGDQFVAYFLPTEDTIKKRKRDTEAGVDYEEEDEWATAFAVHLIMSYYKLCVLFCTRTCLSDYLYCRYEYTLAREYNWNVKNKMSKGYEETYFFVFKDEGVFYNELETRYLLICLRHIHMREVIYLPRNVRRHSPASHYF